MNIVPVYPNIVPMAQQPATESARRDNQLRERIPALKEGQAGATDNKLNSSESAYIASYTGSNNSSTANKAKDDTYSLSSLRQSNADKSLSETASENLTADAVTSKEKEEDPQSEDDHSTSEDSSQQKQDEKVIKDLEARDQEVRTHEQAHKAAGGQYAGSPAFDMSLGPDGKSYATGGHVDIDVSTVPNDPQATIIKMQQIKKAALAPAEPSSQDVKVAARASMIEAAARSDLVKASAEKPMASNQATNESSDSTLNEEKTSSVNKENPFISQEMRRRGVVILNRYMTASSDRQANSAALNQYA